MLNIAKQSWCTRKIGLKNCALEMECSIHLACLQEQSTSCAQEVSEASCVLPRHWRHWKILETLKHFVIALHWKHRLEKAVLRIWRKWNTWDTPKGTCTDQQLCDQSGNKESNGLWCWDAFYYVIISCLFIICNWGRADPTTLSYGKYFIVTNSPVLSSCWVRRGPIQSIIRFI